MKWKKTVLYSILALMVVTFSNACGPSPVELGETATQAAVAMFNTQTAAAPTATLTSTNTPTPSPTNTPEPPTPTNSPTPLPTNTPTVIPSDTPTLTFTPESLVSLGAPPNPESFEAQMALMFEMDKTQRDTVTKNIQDTPPVSQCPPVWVETISDAQTPTYLVYISLTAPKEDSFMVAVHPASSGIDSTGNVSLGVTLPGSDGSIVMTAIYKTPAGQSTPDEFEIQIVFSGCEIYTVLVPWP